MSEAAVVTDLRSALTAAHSAVDQLQVGSLDQSTNEELLDLWRELERLARRLPTVEYRLIHESAARGLPAEHGCRSMGQFLRGLLRLDPREAHGREMAAHAAGSQRALTGELLPPAYPAVAAAQAEGAISARHARIVTSTIENLPDPVRREHAESAEQDLVRHARVFDPKQLGKLALRLTACLDPDGRLEDLDEKSSRRGITVHRDEDGSGTFTGRCTAELMERLLVVFDAFGAPRPEVDGVKDPRTAAQRRHDALLDALALIQRAELLPSTGGVAATVILTMDADAYATGGAGLARTGHGALIPAKEALRWAGANHRLLAVILDKVKGITGYSSTQRCFTETQRLALYARDLGCTFPGCDAPPQWCEAHHLIDYADGGPTTLDNGTLVCGPDHRDRINQGWHAQLINGRVGWIPPPAIDPLQRPRFNQLHDPGGLPEAG